MADEFLYRITPTRADMLQTGPTLEEMLATQAHFAFLEAARAAGIVFAAGRTLTKDASTFGIVIFRAVDEAAARQFMNADPAVEAGVMKAELFPFRIALWAARPSDEPVPPPRVEVPILDEG